MSKLKIDEKLYEPVKVGDPGDWYEGETDAVCDDCGAHYGKQHLEGCDIERCPVCGLQLLSCGHEVIDVYEEDESNGKTEMN